MRRKKWRIIFDKKKQDIEIQDKIVDMELVPGYTIQVPNITYCIISNTEIIEAALLTLLTLQKKNNQSIRIIDFKLRSEFLNEIIIKGDEDSVNLYVDYFKNYLDDTISNLMVKKV